MTSLVLLSDLRTHLNWPSSKGTEDDAELLEMGSAATDACETALARPLRLVDATEPYSGGKPSIRLQRVPCTCISCSPTRSLVVTTVTENGVTLPSNAYSLDSTLGVLWRGQHVTWPWLQVGPAPGITVQYTAGYTSAPSWAQLAVKRMVEHLWRKTQQQRHGRGIASAEDEPNSLSYLLPYMVQELLNPHRAAGWW